MGNADVQRFRLAKTCYLLQDGYVDTFQELLDATVAELRHGVRHPKCANCYGAQWIRSFGGGPYLQRAAWTWLGRQ